MGLPSAFLGLKKQHAITGLGSGAGLQRHTDQYRDHLSGGFSLLPRELLRYLKHVFF